MSNRRRGKKSKKSPRPPRPPKPQRPKSAKEIRRAAIGAVDQAIFDHYGGLSPIFYEIEPVGSAPDLIEAIRAQRVREEGVPPHWHLVTYGLNKLHGREVTIRVPLVPGEPFPPQWAMHLLNTITMHVAEFGRPFSAGERIDLKGPLSLHLETELTALAFVEDPRLPQTPELKFVQLFGLSAAEFEAGTLWDQGQVVSLLLEKSPLGVTKLDRPCNMASDPAFRARVEEGAARDGSSEEAVHVEVARWALVDGSYRITIGAGGVETFKGLLRGRTQHGREFHLYDSTYQVHVFPGEELVWESGPEDETLVGLDLPPAHVERVLAELEPQRGIYEFEGWSIEVVPTILRDERDRVIETIG